MNLIESHERCIKILKSIEKAKAKIKVIRVNKEMAKFPSLNSEYDFDIEELEKSINSLKSLYTEQLLNLLNS